MSLSRRQFLLGSLGLASLAGCAPQTPPQPTATPLPPLPKTLVFYDWVGDMPQPILDAFTKAFAIEVDYQVYNSQEEGADEIRKGKAVDVVILEGQVLGSLLRDKLIHPLNYGNIPNFRNISANFRDLAYDPNNKHSVPYQWGTSGLVYRTDLLPAPAPTSWLDLWRPELTKQVTTWDLARYGVGATLKSLGYSLNATDPAQLEAAKKKLMDLVPNMWAISINDDSINDAPLADNISSGRAALAVGFSYDAASGRDQRVEAGGKATDVDYVLPKEGSLLWGDNFAIPNTSPNQYAAELFINFMLLPEVSAQITNTNFYATPNDQALPLVEKDIRENPWIFPQSEQLTGSEFFLALPPAIESQYLAIWAEFSAAVPPVKLS
jgi:spermidine/putrescine transport system substrate-binding protein